MYPISLKPILSLVRSSRSRTSMPVNVWALSVTSLLTDISSEMVASTLPLIFVMFLHASPAALAAADGLQQGVAGLARLCGGVIADRVRAYRQAAASGYILSALCRVGFLLSTVPAQFAFFLSVDRVGKGFRTGPRDALLVQSAPLGEEARAFGLHRSLDTAGAMLGPLVGYWVLGLVPGDYSSVFVFSFVFAALGIVVLLTFTSNPARAAAVGTPSPPDFGALLRGSSTRKLCLIAALLGASTLSDHVLYLLLQRHFAFELRHIPLLYVATPAACMCFSYPLGWLADRWNRLGVLVGGYMLLLAAYVVAVLPVPAWSGLALVIMLLGLHYAATDGVFLAMASRSLPRATQASGLSLLSTASGVGRLLSGVGFGVLWAVSTDVVAILTFASAAALCIGFCVRLLSHSPELAEV